MQYVALFEEDRNGVSVVFPDFPGCTTCGENLDEAVDNAHEALATYVEDMVERGQTLPEPSEKKKLLSELGGKDKKALNIQVKGDGTDFEEFELVMHTHLLARIEKYCRLYGASPADFLAAAARKAINDDIFAD